MADISAILAEVEKRTRFSEILSLVSPPDEDELTAAVFDSVDDINSFEPSTTYTLDWIMDNQDTRWKRLVYLGAAHNAVRMLLADWTANGIDVDLGDGVALASKLSDYQALESSLKEEFNEKIERLKTAALKFSSVRHFSTSKTMGSTTFSSRANRYRKSTRT